MIDKSSSLAGPVAKADMLIHDRILIMLKRMHENGDSDKGDIR